MFLIFCYLPTVSARWGFLPTICFFSFQFNSQACLHSCVGHASAPFTPEQSKHLIDHGTCRLVQDLPFKSLESLNLEISDLALQSYHAISRKLGKKIDSLDGTSMWEWNQVAWSWTVLWSASKTRKQWLFYDELPPPSSAFIDTMLDSCHVL